LRGTIDWSYDLLGDDEKQLFRRLAVFAGSFDLEAAEEVCDADLDTLASLVDKSLLRQTIGGRFFILATIREYAAERLEASGEADELRSRHAEHFLALVEEAEPELLGGAAESVWLDRLSLEHPNLQSALRWLSEHDGTAWRGLRMARALWRFWWLRSNVAEGRAELRTLLDRAGPLAPPELRARALQALGDLAFRQGDRSEAGEALGSALALTLETGDQLGTAMVERCLGRLAIDEGRHAEARPLLERSLAVERELGRESGLTWTLTYLGWLALFDGDHARADALLSEGLARSRERRDLEGVGRHLLSLGHLALDRREPAVAAGRLAESLRIFAELDYKSGVAYVLEAMAQVAAMRGRSAPALRLAGAAAALRESTGATHAAEFRARHERRMADARAAVDDREAAATLVAGRAAVLDDIVAEAAELAAAFSETPAGAR
jgi:tetratricopeptide (TPR) repeat protein